MANSTSWEKIFEDHGIAEHDFNSSIFVIDSEMIKASVQNFTKTAEKEVRILCSQTKREEVPEIMGKLGLFLLPIKNGAYALVRGDGYIDIPEIKTKIDVYQPEIDWKLETSGFGNSEMQHLDYAFAISIIGTFIEDDSLHLTIRGRKRCPRFDFKVGHHTLQVESGVQTEVDAGYEGRNQIVLIEAKNLKTQNTIIRQLYYPFRLWSANVPKKRIRNVFFEKRGKEYLFWEFQFRDKFDYNSIELVKSARYKVATD